MRIILIRHGEPNYEKDCLTERGHRQAEAAAQRLLKEDIDEIYSSPHGRAIQTAEAYSRASGNEKIQILDFMKEIRYGRENELYNEEFNPWTSGDKLIAQGESMQLSDWRDMPLYRNNTARIDADKIAAESDRWLSSLGYEREGLYYRHVKSDYDQKTIALFCHGGSSSAFLSRMLNQQFPYICTYVHFQLTAISILRFDETPGNLAAPHVELLNDSTHIRGIL